MEVASLYAVCQKLILGLNFGLFVNRIFQAPFATMLMQSFGRPRVFYAGCFLGVFGALVNAWATYIHHHGDFWKPFILLSLGSLFMGFSNGIGNLFRFAAADVVPEHKRSFAISAVLFGTVFSLSTQLTAAGGDLAALSGPPLALWAKNQLWDFGASYLCVAALYLCCFVVLLFVTLPDFTTPEQSRKEPRSLCQLFTNPKLVLALGTGTISFGYACLTSVTNDSRCMVLLMTLVPLVINGNFDEGKISLVLQIHGVGMFLPSLFVGFIIQKIGLLATDCVGLFIMIVGSLVMPMIGNQYWTFVLGLFLCGFGWNLSFVSSTTMLTECYFVRPFLIFQLIRLSHQRKPKRKESTTSSCTSWFLRLLSLLER